MEAERTEQLKALMARYGLKAKDVATLLGRSESTVRIWRVAGGKRAIPSDTLELLALKAEAKAKAGSANA